MTPATTTLELGIGAPLNLELLIETRMLIQAQSGGGKTTALRRLLEQSHGRIQHLVIDPEGEFSTLREHFDYVLAARHHGDTVADPRSAKLLAERLLELGVSAILDLYELKAHERIRFVRLFLEALVEAPRALRHPVLVVIDEAHVFCPEKGQAESAPAVIDLCARGRKRGLCAILATQRLSKLHKDAAAELRNVLVGATGLDIDQQRAGDVLGFGKAERLALRDLKWRQFYAYGPALSPGVKLITTGDTTTKNPPAGHALAPPPPPTAKVKALLPKLADLPAEAEERAKSVADLQRELATVRRQLTLSLRGAPVAPPTEKLVEKRVEVAVLKEGQLARLEKVTERFAGVGTEVATVGRELAQVLGKLNPNGHRPAVAPRPLPVAATAPRAAAPRVAASAPSDGLSAPEQAILDTVLMLNTRGISAGRESVARWLGIHPNGGRYGSNLARLRADGFLEGFTLTAIGTAAATPQDTGLEAGLRALSDDPKRQIVRTLVDAGQSLSREELAAALGIHPNGGRYGSNLAWLRTMGVITDRGPIAVTDGLLR
jgi:uncharacterized protein